MFKSESKFHTANLGSPDQWDRSKLWDGILIGPEGFGYLEPGIFWKQHNIKNPGTWRRLTTLLLKIPIKMTPVGNNYILW